MILPRGNAPRWLLSVAVAALLHPAGAAHALDKQGSAHGGDVEGPSSGFAVTGAAMLGVAVYNPTYAARPDNSGHALFRYAGHADFDLIGRRLSIPVDINMFTDRDRHGAEKLIPSELDLIGGVTSTWRAGPGAVEFGVRAEMDMNVDRGSYSQTYVDVRTRYLYSLASEFPCVGDSLGGGDLSGAATLGVFAFNPTYAARPDNTGIALFRYALRNELSFLDSHGAVALDATLFTDRHHDPVTPSELDLTPELIGRLSPYELHVAYERDMPIAEPAALSATHPVHVQQFVYLLFAWGFDVTKKTPQSK